MAPSHALRFAHLSHPFRLAAVLAAFAFTFTSLGAEGAPLDPRLKPPGSRVVRKVFQAALGDVDLSQRQARLSTMASRSRWSALLPTVSARAGQTIRESMTNPVDRDPYATSRTGLYLELRAIWSLDRLVYTRDEIQIERLRDEYGDMRRRRLHDTAAAISEWTRARAETALVDEGSPEWVEATARRATSEALLEELTGGKFSDMVGPSPDDEP